MRLLRSPAVTGMLVLLAVGVVIYQVMQGTRGRGGAAAPAMARAAAPPSSLAAPPPASVAPAASAKPGSMQQPGMDRGRIGMSFRGWVAGPTPDPFDLRQRATPKKKAPINAPSVLAKLKLQGILLQTGSRIALINGHSYAEGETIEGYRIVGIEPDTVWFETPNSREHLNFSWRPAIPTILPSKSPETNSPPPLGAEKDDTSGAKSQ